MSQGFESGHDTLPGLSDLERLLAHKANEAYRLTKHLEDADPIGGQRARKIASLVAQRDTYANWPNSDEKRRLSPTHPAKDPHLTIDQGL